MCGPRGGSGTIDGQPHTSIANTAVAARMSEGHPGEDPLAAEVMGMPVNRLKLMAFAFGASVAALTGTFATALNGSVFPQNFEFPLLITVYTMVILGGAGNQAGVVVGAVLVSVLLEALRDPGDSRGMFYVLIVLSLVAGFVTFLIVRTRGGDDPRDSA